MKIESSDLLAGVSLDALETWTLRPPGDAGDRIDELSR
jgi:hypothetical protein